MSYEPTPVHQPATDPHPELSALLKGRNLTVDLDNIAIVELY